MASSSFCLAKLAYQGIAESGHGSQSSVGGGPSIRFGLKALMHSVRGQSGTIAAVVNALAKAGVDLGENGSVIPKPKGRAR